MKSTDLYIDLGTANTLIYARKQGFLLNEPSVLTLAQRRTTQQIFALGRSAKPMLGKTPHHLSVIRPLRQGVISDFENTARMLHAFIKRIKANMFWFRPRMIISLPCQVTQFEKRAVEEVGSALGARYVHLLDEPMAAAVGAGLPVLNSSGQMIVDIGGGTTEIAVLSLGGIVTSRAVRIGGDDIDEAIVNRLRSAFHFHVGLQTAERIKIAVAMAQPPFATNSRQLTVGGLNLRSGLPGRITVDTQMVFPAVDDVLCEIFSAMRKALEECPPEIAGDIARNGVVLAGGGALLPGLQARAAQEIGLPIAIADQPLFSVALGGARMLNEPRLFERTSTHSS